MPEPIALPPAGDSLRSAAGPVTAARRRSCTLDLSRSRTHDAALDILKAYKLTGNFHNSLEVVLKDMGAFDLVTYRIESNPAPGFGDHRHVVFAPNDDVSDDRFDETIRSIRLRIGFRASWWGRMLRRLRPGAADAAQCAAPIIANA